MAAIFADEYTPISQTSFTLHELQIRKIIKVVSDVAATEIDMPCVYSCVNAAKEFLISGRLSQAGLALLPYISLTHPRGQDASAPGNTHSPCKGKQMSVSLYVH